MTKRVGAPKKPRHLKKMPISIKLPRWLLDRLDEQDESRAVQIEQALMKLHKDWKPAPVYKQVDIVESLPDPGEQTVYTDKNYWISRLENVDDMNKYKGIRFSMPSDIFHELIDLLESTFIRLGGDNQND